MKKQSKSVPTVPAVVEQTPVEKSQALLDSVLAITLDTPEKMVQAVELGLKLKGLSNWGEAEKKLKSKPLHDEWKAELAKWKPFEDILEKAEKMIKQKIDAHDEALRQKALADAAALEKKIESGYITKPETIVAKQQEIELQQPARAVFTAFGSSHTKDVKEVTVVDVSLVPREYMVVDFPRLKKAALAADENGMSIAGVEVKMKKQIAFKA